MFRITRKEPSALLPGRAASPRPCRPPRMMIEQLAGLGYVAMVVSRLVGLLVLRQPEKG